MRGGPAPDAGGGGGGPNPFEGGMPGGFSFGGMPSGGTRTFHFSPGGGGFRFSSADDIFRNFASAGGGMGGFGEEDDIFSNILGGGGGFGPNIKTSTRGPGGGGFAKPRRPPTPEVVEKELPLTLEEINSGVSKKVTTKSKTLGVNGKANAQDVTLEANIKPGLRTGSKIKYKNVGDQEVHLVVTEVS